MKAVGICVLVLALAASVSAASLERLRMHAAKDEIQCNLITSCELCAQRQTVNSILVNPCFWDFWTNSCQFRSAEDHYCKGNQQNASGECAQCKKMADDKKAAKAKKDAAAGAAASAQGAAAAAAGKAGKRCMFDRTTPGICVATAAACGGRPSVAKGCMNPATPVCCGLAVKNKLEKADGGRCTALSGASKCFACLRAGCNMHEATAKCVPRSSAFAKGNGVIADESFCHTVGKKQAERRAKVKANAAKKGGKKL